MFNNVFRYRILPNEHVDPICLVHNQPPSLTAVFVFYARRSLSHYTSMAKKQRVVCNSLGH